MSRERTPTYAWAQALPVSSRMADGAIRGAGIGLLWGIFWGPSEAHFARSGAAGAAAAVRPALHALTHGGMATIGFAMFLGGYNGIYSAIDRIGGQKTLSAFTAGGVMGGVLGGLSAGVPLKPKPGAIGTTLTTAAGTALLCAGCQMLWDDPD